MEYSGVERTVRVTDISASPEGHWLSNIFSLLLLVEGPIVSSGACCLYYRDLLYLWGPMVFMRTFCIYLWRLLVFMGTRGSYICIYANRLYLPMVQLYLYGPIINRFGPTNLVVPIYRAVPMSSCCLRVFPIHC